MSSRPLAEDTEGPTVIALDDDGREIVDQRPRTPGQAGRAAARLQHELDTAGRAEFAFRYGLHLDEADRERSWSRPGPKTVR